MLAIFVVCVKGALYKISTRKPQSNPHKRAAMEERQGFPQCTTRGQDRRRDRIMVGLEITINLFQHAFSIRCLFLHAQTRKMIIRSLCACVLSVLADPL